MISFITRRILVSVIIMLAVFTTVFLIVRVLPGDPARVALGDYASQEAVQALRERMGLNAPIWVQYKNSFLDYLHGDLGNSLINGRPISSQVAVALPYTLQLAIAGNIVACFLGIPLGVWFALNRNNLVDTIGRVVSLIGVSVPTFYLGIILLFLLSIKLNAFPAMGGGDLTNFGDSLNHLFLPAITLGLALAAYLTRLTRSAFLESLQEDYIRTARSKGARETIVLYKHCLRNVLVPVTSAIGIFAVSSIGESVLIEMVFTRNGLGRMMVNSILQRDYIMLQSVMIVFAALVVLINLSIDLLYGFIDPRIRHG